MSFARKTVLYSIGGGVSQVSILLRGIVIARLIGPENMGIAAVFIAVASFGEMITTTGGDRFLIQDRDGDEPRAAGSLHSVSIVRGILLSLAMIALAVPCAALFGIANAWAGFVGLAFVPLFRGFQSLDSIVQQRALRFSPRLAIDVSGEVFALAAGCATAYMLRDWRAVIAANIAQAAMVLLVSHLVARHPYRLAYDREIVRRATRFAMPFFASSVLLFLALHGDRLAMAIAEGATGSSAYSFAEIGRYLVAASVAVLPVRTSANMLRNVFLPWLRTSSSPAHAGERRRDLVLGFALLVMLYLIFAVSTCGELIEIVFGSVFGDLHAIVAVLAIAQGLRILRVVGNISAIASGDSVNTLWGSIARTSGVAAAILFVFLGEPILMLAVASIIGETIALVVCEYTLRRRHGERAGPWWTTVVAVVLMVFASAVSWFSHAWFGPWIGLAVSLLVCAGTIGLALVLSSRFRAACRNLVKVLSRRGGGGSRGSKAGSAAGELPAD